MTTLNKRSLKIISIKGLVSYNQYFGVTIVYKCLLRLMKISVYQQLDHVLFRHAG